jgi:cytoplasmic iron level regulating protein YaaA (DUF328/UPF0246 family)
MLALISPSKTLNFETYKPVGETSAPLFVKDSVKLIKILKEYSVKDIEKLMGISTKLAELNHQRFKSFSSKFTEENSKQAIFAFKGDVYEGFNVELLTDKEIKTAQKKIAIISGLYGLLQPLDLIQPYRLEMGTKLKNEKGSDLYKFWGSKISERLNELETKTIINLASQEYFKAVDKKLLKANIIDVNFLEKKNGSYKTIALFAKRARGLMARYITKNNLNKAEDLKGFDYEDYSFNNKLSNEQKLTFTRG